MKNSSYCLLYTGSAAPTNSFNARWNASSSSNEFVSNLLTKTSKVQTKKVLGETQTLRTGCSKAESKNFCLAADPLPAICIPNFIEIGWFLAQIYSDKTIFKNGGRRRLPPSWIFKIWYFGHITCVRTWFCFILQNFTLIRSFVEI